MIVWGGSSYSRSRADGAAYNPATDSWRKLLPAPLRPRHYRSATWTGSEVIVFGGYDFHRTFRDGASGGASFIHMTTTQRLAPQPEERSSNDRPGPPCERSKPARGKA